MVTSAEVKSLLESLPKDLNNCAFLSDAYTTLRAYNGEEMSKEVVDALNLIKSFINKEINAIDDTQTLTPEEAVVINDYLSIYKEDELSSKQKSVRDGLKPLLDKYDQENDLDKINQNTDVSERLDTWNDIANSSVPVFSRGRDNEISIAEQYREFEKFLGLLKSKDLEELVDVLKVSTTQELSKKPFPLSTSTAGYAGYYAKALKDNIEKAEAQTILTYLVLEKAEKKEKENIKNGKIDLASAKIKYSITDADIKNFDFSDVDKDRLTLAVNITSCINAANSNIVALRIKQKTNALSVWYKVKQLDRQLSERHPKLYSAAKNIVKRGQKMAVRTALVGTLGGVKGFAIYAGYEIGSAVHKNYKMFAKEKAKAQQAGKSYYKNYLQYITAKENRKALKEMTSTAAIAATTAYFGAFADAAKAVARPLAVGAISIATSMALIPEKRRAREDLKKFLISAGIKEKDISEKKLRLSPQKYTSELLIINGIVLNSKQEQEFEQKLNNLIQIRREQAARVGGAAVGAAVGLGINSGIVNSGGLGHFLNKIATRGGQSGELTEDISDTTQEHNYTNIDKDSLMSNENNSANAPTDTQTQEVATQKATANTTHHNNTTSVSHANQSNNLVDEQPSSQSQNLQSEQEANENTSQSSFDPNSDCYSVTQPEDNVFITNDGVIVELVDQDSQVKMVYSDNVSEYREEDFAAIDRNIYNAISEKENPTNTEIRFADEYAEANNLPAPEQTVPPQSGLSPEDEELLKKLGVNGKNVTIEHTIDENGKVHTRIIQRNVAPSNTQSNEISNAPSNETTMQERIEQQRERISARQQDRYATPEQIDDARKYGCTQDGKYILPSQPPKTPLPASEYQYIPPSQPPMTPLPASEYQYIPPSEPPMTPPPGEHFSLFGWFHFGHHVPQSMPPHTPPASGAYYMPPSEPPMTPPPGGSNIPPSQPPVTPQPGGSDIPPSQPPVTPQPGENGNNPPSNGGGRSGSFSFGHRGRGNGGR